MTDQEAMGLALTQAGFAAAAGEVPVGAVVLHQGRVIAVGYNAPIGLHDPSAHAEMLALRAAALFMGNYRLDDCELFVTLEPCAMCAGVILHARLKRVVFGASDPKTGAAGSVLNLFASSHLNHHTQIQGGVLAASCTDLLKGFFQQRRQFKALRLTPLREDALRTPASRFVSLPKMSGESDFIHDLPALNGLFLHFVDNRVVHSDSATLCLHGSRNWSLVWRTLMADHPSAGARVVAPDLIGFGMSDKPKKESFHTVMWHAQVLLELIGRLNLSQVMLVVPAGEDAAIHAVGKKLISLAGSRIVTLDALDADLLGTEASNAPYPDKGYRAAIRAFSRF